MSRSLARYATDPVAFIDTLITRNERGEPFRLAPHQRDILKTAFTFDASGRLPWDTFLYSCIKKSGKTTINAAVTTWWAFTQEAPNELYTLANDQEQAQSRVFSTVARLIRSNPALAESAVSIDRGRIVLSNETEIKALASEYAGAAGSNHGLTSWDELWAYTSEGSRRLWEELTPVPTRRNSIRIITTYAGWENESALLWDLYRQGVGPEEHPEGQGTRLHPTWPLFINRAARLLVYWDHEARMPWQTPAYVATQQRTLRAGTFLRLFRNMWAVNATAFITPDLWDPCVAPEHRPMLPSRGTELFVGVDAGIKHDAAAVVAVVRHEETLRLATYRIWTPSPTEPLDVEATVEAYLRELHAGYMVRAILCDPYQLHRSITTLTAAGLPIAEFPQTTANTTRMGQVLFDLLRGRNLVLAPGADDLRAQALNTVAVESPRGWRIAKEKASKKIDAIVALSMACVAALDAGPALPPLLFGTSDTGYGRLIHDPLPPLRDDDDDDEVAEIDDTEIRAGIIARRRELEALARAGGVVSPHDWAELAQVEAIARDRGILE